MRSALDKFKCQYGTCIVMEVKTGKVRAMVNLGMKKDSTYDEILNYALLPTEPGSTFKLATLTALFNDKYVNTETEVDAENGTKVFGKRLIRDSHSGIGKVPVWKAFAKSSNVAMAKLAYQYYHNNPKKFVEHLHDLKLNKPTGIDLPGELDRIPRIRETTDKLWSATSIISLAIGYEVSISPLQTCMLYNALANDGKMMRPYMVSAIREYGKDVVSIQPEVVATLGDASVVRQLKKCARAVVSDDGTGKEIKSNWYNMAGKTGTAKVVDAGISYDDDIYQGSFVGYFPAEEPKYTVCVVIRTMPHSKAYYGGAIAAPVFKMVADKIFSLNIGAWDAPLDSLAHSGSWRLTSGMATTANYQALLNGIQMHAAPPSDYVNKMSQLICDSNRKLSLHPVNITLTTIPDLKGMGLKDAVYILEHSKLKVKIIGKGRVQSQSLQPGTKLIEGESITLQLS
jgi:cell division protein FtsI (penicillin-binding protein 3)